MTGMLQWRDKSEGKCTNLLLGWFIKLNLTVIGHIHLHSCVNQHKKSHSFFIHYVCPDRLSFSILQTLCAGALEESKQTREEVKQKL